MSPNAPRTAKGIAKSIMYLTKMPAAKPSNTMTTRADAQATTTTHAHLTGPFPSAVRAELPEMRPSMNQMIGAR